MSGGIAVVFARVRVVVSTESESQSFPGHTVVRAGSDDTYHCRPSISQILSHTPGSDSHYASQPALRGTSTGSDDGIAAESASAVDDVERWPGYNNKAIAM